MDVVMEIMSYCAIWAPTTKMDLQRLHTLPVTLGGEKGMRETRVVA